MNLQLVQPWKEADLARVCSDAVRVLAEIGIACDHQPTISLLRERGFAEMRNGRLFFCAPRLQEEVERARPRTTPPDDDCGEFSMTGCWTCLNYCDPETGEVRAASTAEAERMARFWDARGVTGYGIPLMACDVSPELVTLHGEWIGLRNSRGLGGELTVTDPQEIRYLSQMYKAAGRRYRMLQMIGLSPLRFDTTALEAIFSFKDDPAVEILISGFIPSAGATCPLDPLSALTHSIAEEISVDCVRMSLGLRDRLGFGCRLDPFDFRYAMHVLGSPEWCLYHGLIRSLHRHLGFGPGRFGVFRSVAKQPDAQAVCERTACVMWQALQGARHFYAVGQLSIDEVFSPVQAILDGEIIGYVARLVRGFPADSVVQDPVALIREGVAETSFLTVEDTVTRFRDLIDSPQLFRHWGLGRWRDEGARTIQAEAWDAAQAMIAKSDFHLPPDVERDVDAVYRRAVEYIRSRHTSGR